MEEKTRFIVVQAPRSVIVRPEQGPQGMQGPPGAAGLSSFIFTQNSPVNPWVIPHTLGDITNITVLDSSGEEMFADVSWNSPIQVTITFGGPTSGRAILTA